MLKAARFKILPTKAQAVLIDKHIGCARFIYNLALETKQNARNAAGVSLSYFDLSKQLTELKEECEWLRDVNSQSLQQAIRNLDKAFLAFFRKNSGYPKFKKKAHKGGFIVPQDVKVRNGRVFIPKFQEGIPIALHRPIQGNIKQATVTRTPTGKYFITIFSNTGEPIPPKPAVAPKTTLGIDLGLKTFIVTSNSEEYDNPKFLRKAQARLKFVQRKFSKHKGKRTQLKFARLHEKVANQRKDFLHKLSTKLIRENQSIAVEDLDLKELLKKSKSTLMVHDAGWGMFTDFLKYKSEWYGVNLLQIGRFEPSSKTCSACQTKKDDLKLSDRTWTCKSCGTTHDRDVNAAINIKQFALNKTLSGADREIQEELPTLVGALTPDVERQLTKIL